MSENNKEQIKKSKDQKKYKVDIRPGMTVKVYEKIKDIDAKGKEKTRTQIFEGIILAVKKPKTQSATFTVRKEASGVGVEKVYPLYSPLIDKIVPIKQARVRRAKLYYLRNSKNKLKEKKL